MGAAKLGNRWEGKRRVEMRSETSTGQGKEFDFFFSKGDEKSLEDFQWRGEKQTVLTIVRKPDGRNHELEQGAWLAQYRGEAMVAH